MQSKECFECPLCSTIFPDSYALTLHVEEAHYADDSPFVATSDSVEAATSVATAESHVPATRQSSDEQQWIPCQEGSCGELVLWRDLSDHLYLHAVEMAKSAELPSNISLDDYDPGDHSSLARTGLGRTAKKASSSKSKSSIGGVVRLGVRKIAPLWTFSNAHQTKKAELGPYAHEERMPAWLLEILARGGRVYTTNRIRPDGKSEKFSFVENKVHGTIPVLARLLEAQAVVEKAYLCHPDVQHIFKLPNEGSFCGYRNIQMAMSWMEHAKPPGWENVLTDRPSVIDLQKMIEQAWDQGFNGHGKEETGGIFKTRKYIGTPEAQALFDSADISTSCEICREDSTEDVSAYTKLSEVIGAYFEFFAQGSQPDSKIVSTSAPPIYLQMPGHSVTVVGIERRKDGNSNLLVFDPSYGPPRLMRELLGLPLLEKKLSRMSFSGGPSRSKVSLLGKEVRSTHAKILESYRRGSTRLRRAKEFELLMFVSSDDFSKEWRSVSEETADS